jgi:hypothetical protein
VRDERSDLEALVPREVARADRLESAVKKSNTSSAVVNLTSSHGCRKFFAKGPVVAGDDAGRAS